MSKSTGRNLLPSTRITNNSQSAALMGTSSRSAPHASSSAAHINTNINYNNAVINTEHTPTPTTPSRAPSDVSVTPVTLLPSTTSLSSSSSSNAPSVSTELQTLIALIQQQAARQEESDRKRAEEEQRHRKEVAALRQSIAALQRPAPHVAVTDTPSGSSSPSLTATSSSSSSSSSHLAALNAALNSAKLEEYKSELKRAITPTQSQPDDKTKARKYVITKPSTLTYDEEDEQGDGEDTHYVYVDEEERKVMAKEQHAAQHEKTIYEDEEANESVLQSFIKWLEKREKCYPFMLNRRSVYYRKRHSLLNAAGRRMEWIRFAFKSEFNVALYGRVMNRWYLRFMQEHAGQFHTHHIRKVKDAVLEMPAWSYDSRDVRINNNYNDNADDIPVNSQALSSLPTPLRYAPSRDELAPSFTGSVSEYGMRYVQQLRRRRRTSARRRARGSRSLTPSDPSYSSSSSSEDDLEHFECAKCGVTVKDRQWSRYCENCELIVRNVARMRTQMKQESEAPPPLEKEYDHESELKRAAAAAVKRENDKKEGAATGITADDAGELGSVMMEVFTEAGRAAVKLTRGELVKYTVSDTARAVESTLRQCGTFDGDVKRAPQWLRVFCTCVYTHRFKQHECLRVMTLAFTKEAKSWYDSNLSEVSLLAEKEPTKMRVVEVLLLRFKKQYMGPTQIRMYREQIRSTKLTGASSVRDLKQHYETFVSVANNLRVCDKSVSEDDIKGWYWEALPYQIAQYIGPAYKDALTLDRVFQMAEESVTKSSSKQDINIDGEMRARLNAMTINDDDTHYDDAYDHEYDEYHTAYFNALNARNNRRPADPHTMWMNRNLSGALCYHCGARGHQTGDCPLINQPQTVQGKAAWASRNRLKGRDYTYDKQYYINNKFTYPSSTTSAASNSSSSTSSAAQSSSRGRQPWRKDNTNSSQPSALQQRLRDVSRGINRGGRGNAAKRSSTPHASAAPSTASTAADAIPVTDDDDDDEGSA